MMSNIGTLSGESIPLQDIPGKILDNGVFEIFADLKEEMRSGENLQKGAANWDNIAGKITNCEAITNKTSQMKRIEHEMECTIRSWLIPVRLKKFLKTNIFLKVSMFVYVLVSTIVLINIITSFLT